MKEKKVLIFDWDGTLIDSTKCGIEKIQSVFTKLGVEMLPEEVIKRACGMRIDLLFDKITKEYLNNEITAGEFASIYYQAEEYYPQMGSLVKTLTTLKNFGYKLALITSRSNESWLKSCKSLNFDYDFFDYAQTSCHYYCHKPSGKVFEPIVKWALGFNYSPDNLVYFGDTVAYDLAATKDHQPSIDFVGVVSGVNTIDEFINAGVKECNIVSSYSELPNYLKQFTKVNVEV